MPKCGHCKKKLEETKYTKEIKASDSFIICEECNEPDWEGKCENCEASPIHKITGMCGPCTYGEADTVGGNW